MPGSRQIKYDCAHYIRRTICRLYDKNHEKLNISKSKSLNSLKNEVFKAGIKIPWISLDFQVSAYFKSKVVSDFLEFFAQYLKASISKTLISLPQLHQKTINLKMKHQPSDYHAKYS